MTFWLQMKGNCLVVLPHPLEQKKTVSQKGDLLWVKENTMQQKNPQMIGYRECCGSNLFYSLQLIVDILFPLSS